MAHQALAELTLEENRRDEHPNQRDVGKEKQLSAAPTMTTMVTTRKSNQRNAARKHNRKTAGQGAQHIEGTPLILRHAKVGHDVRTNELEKIALANAAEHKPDSQSRSAAGPGACAGQQALGQSVHTATFRSMASK